MQKIPIAAITRKRAGYYNARSEYARLSGGSPVARLANAQTEKYAQHGIDWFLRVIADDVKSGKRPEYAFEYNGTLTPSIVLPELVSIYATVDHFAGGAHPNTEYNFINVGLVQGRAKVLTVGDLFHRDVPGQRIVADAVYARLRKIPDANWINDSDAIIKQGDPLLTKPFVLTRAGLTFLFAPYVVGPYSAGTITVKIPYTELGNRLDPAGPLSPLLR